MQQITVTLPSPPTALHPLPRIVDEPGSGLRHPEQAARPPRAGPADGPLEICRPHADQEAGVDPRSREGRKAREIRFLRVEAGTLAALSG